MLSVGHGNYVAKHKISGIYYINSNPIKDIVSSARIKEILIDATRGKATKSVVVLSDGYVILSSIAAKTLAERFSA